MNKFNKVFELSGLSNKQLARLFNTSTRTIIKWKVQDPDNLPNTKWEQFQRFSELVLSFDTDDPSECKAFLLGWGDHASGKSPYRKLLETMPRGQILQPEPITVSDALGLDYE